MEIAGIPVGLGHRPLIVAEIGAAHNGSLATAIQLIGEAKRAGADMVKVQCYLPETITADFDRPEFVIQEGPWKGERLIELYRKAHMPRAWFPHLFAEAIKLEIPLFASVFSLEDVEFIKEFNPPAYKIASFELVDTPLIRHAVGQGKPMIVSTGMSSWGEITSAARFIKGWNTIWLHCISAYPTSIGDTELSMLGVLKRQFDFVGFSDHTQRHEPAMMALAMGACMIEKHITLGGGGPDDHFALSPHDFSTFCLRLDQAWAAMGKMPHGPAKAMGGADREHAPLRRSLYVVEGVRAGELLTSANVRSIRPGLGMSPKHYDQVIGAKASMDIPAGTPLATHHLLNWKED